MFNNNQAQAVDIL